MPNFSFLACVEVADRLGYFKLSKIILVRLVRLAGLVRLVRLG